MDLTTSTKPVSPLRIPPAQPIRKTRLWLYGEPAAENSAKNPELDRNEGRALGEDSEIGQDALGLANSANTPSRESFSPPTARVIHSSEVPQPFWEPDYPSRRFRPEEYEKDDSYYSPPPQFFSPPTSPNELSVKDLAEHERMASSMGNPYAGMKPTPFAPAYQGILTNSNSNSYTTAYSSSANRSKFVDATDGGVHTVMNPMVGQDTTEKGSFSRTEATFSASNTMSKDTSNDIAFNESSFSTRNEHHPSSDICLDSSGTNVPMTNQNQTKTFQQLATERGVSQWDSEILDERWLPANRNEQQPRTSKREITSKEIENVSRRHKRMESFLKELDDTEENMNSQLGIYRPDPSIWGLENTYPRYARALRGSQPTSDLVPEPPEPERLRKVVRDLEDGTEALPRGISHHPDVLRRFLYDRIFEGEWDGQILGPEGDNMTKHGGNFISLKALRDQVLKDIEDLIAFMKVPVGENARSAIYHRTPEAKASLEGGESGGQSGVKEPFVPQYMPGINSRGYRYVVREEQHPTSQEDDPEAKDSQPSSVNTSKGKSAIPNIFSRATYASPRPAYLPFSEQLTSIESRQPFLEQLRAIESRADSRFGGSSLSNQASEHDNKVKDESADHESSVSSKASPLTTQHTSSPHTAASQRRSSREATLVASDKDTMDNATLAEILQQPLQPEVRQNIMDANFPNRSQHGAHNFGYQVPPQYQQPSFDRPPGQGFLSATDPTSWSYRPYNQMGYGYQSSFDSAQLPRYPLPQALQYSSQYRPVPMQPAPYPPQTLDYTSLSHGPPPPRSRPGEPRSYWSGEAPARDPAVLALEQGLRELDTGPPPPHRHYGNVAIRPPSSNRVAAYVYRNDPAFQYNGLPQVRGTPAPAPSAPQGNATTSVPSQNQHEWQNRFGLVQATKPDIPVMPYRPGSDDMRPHATPGASSVPYQNLTRNVVPTLEDVRAPEVNPFQEPARDAKPPGWGVLKIGNIPYDITKGLVAAFLGPHAKTINPAFGPAIHIIMDRNSGKTMDCYVEFLSTHDARNCCNSINLRQHGLNRILERLVDVTMSSQDELLAVLFPKAKNVKWEGGSPVIMEPEEDWSSGFKTFVSAEELGLMVKHAEQPHRSTFTLRSPQRPYEAMISLLAKYPWHSVANYKLSDRTKIFNAARQILSILSATIRHHVYNPQPRPASDLYGNPIAYGLVGRRGSISHGGGGALGLPPIMLNEELLHDLLSAGLNAVGFSERQRYELYEICDYARHHFIVSPLLQYWPFEVLCRKPRAEEDVIEFYAHILSNNPEIQPTGHPFGSVTHLLRSVDMETHTMHDIGQMEMKMLDALLIGGLDNERDEREEKLMQRQRLLALGF